MIKREVKVAFTAPDNTNANRLRIPDCGVVSLRLVAGDKKTGKKKSNSYLPPDAPKPKKAEAGSDDFHFAPDAESISIVYELDNKFEVIRTARIELFSRYRQAPLWTLDLTKLGDDWFSHGEHTVKWDGRIITPTSTHTGVKVKGKSGLAHDLTVDAPDIALQPDFPDGYVTLARTPYKLKLTIGAGSALVFPAVAWTYFHILVNKVELAYGSDMMLPTPPPPPQVGIWLGPGDHRPVLAALIAQEANPPAKGAKVKVLLGSNCFKIASKEMFKNSLYTYYEVIWGDGPMIPILATIKIADSRNQPVLAPKALGRVKFLWDWESKSAAMPGETFVNQAQDFHQGITKPKGQNCHKDRGGKRADDAKAVFPAQPGYAPADVLTDGVFPFEVVACPAPRTWAAYSYAWRDKLLAGKTGVIFQPSRMAGDSYALSLYVAWDKDVNDKETLNVDADAPLPCAEALKVTSGVFEVWRKLHLRKLVRKTATGMPALNLDTICGCYKRAFLELENVSGTPDDFASNDWDVAITAATGTWTAKDKLLLHPDPQHAKGPAGVYFRTRDEYMIAWREKEIRAGLTAINVSDVYIDAIAPGAASAANAVAAGVVSDSVASPHYNPGDVAIIKSEVKAKWKDVTDWMDNKANGYDTNPKYAKKMEAKAIAVLIKVFDTKFTHGDGVYIFQVEQSHNLVHIQAGGVILGEALDFSHATPLRCGFLLMCRAGGVSCGLEKVCAHEIGHHFFLPHPPDSGEKKDHKAHDHGYQAVLFGKSSCLMSYNFSTAMELCGFCQLRLRGWSKEKLDPVGKKNQAK